MRKGMIQQVFLFLFALIMMALILVFGVRQLFLVTETADRVETSAFVKDFESIVQTYYNLDVGSTKIVSLRVPSLVKQICFFNPGEQVSGITDPVLKAMLGSNRKDNLYLLPLEAFQSPGPDFFIPHLRAKSKTNPFCVLIKNNKLEVFLETVFVQGSIQVEVRDVGYGTP